MKTPVESLLSLKRWQEDEAKNIFAALLKALDLEEKRLYELESMHLKICETLRRKSDEFINIDDIKKQNEYLEHLLRMIHRQTKVIAQKEKEVEESRRLLAEATKEKKIFERLDDKHREAIKKEIIKTEQAATDEHAVTGHIRKKKAS
jgi:flagellar FliJ protein